uniref:Uncharacterized protein n=1 Tax=Setaria italica TaxID=4555 RepID=K3ZPT2_SETIT
MDACAETPPCNDGSSSCANRKECVNSFGSQPRHWHQRREAAAM